MSNPTARILIHSEEPEIALDVLKQTHEHSFAIACTDYSDLKRDLETHNPNIVYSSRSESKRFPRDDLLNCESVIWISNAGSGVNHLMPWHSDKTTVTNSAGVAADMMAEYALGVMLHFSLDIPGLKQDQQNHHWHTRVVSPIYGKTLLILGLGKTGQAMAKKSKALNMKVIGVRARVQPTQHVDHVYKVDALHTALAQADYILVCMPMLASTKGMLGEKEFAAIKSGAVIIDVSRGGIVQEKELIRALDSGRIKGAGLDVFETEPLPTDSVLWEYPNIIISPHCSSVYDGWEKRSAQLFAENLTRWKNAEPLENIVDPERGY